MKYLLWLGVAVPRLAQHYEIGAHMGYGFYRNGTIYLSAWTADAGIRNRFMAGLMIGEEISAYVSGEFNYLCHDGSSSRSRRCMG